MNLHPLSAMAPAAASRSGSEGDFLQDLVRLLGGDGTAVPTAARIPVSMRRLDEGCALAHEGAPLKSLHVVRCGSLKCVRTLEDGYEQVTTLALPGDVLGFDGLHCGRHAATDVALEFSIVYTLPLSMRSVPPIRLSTELQTVKTVGAGRLRIGDLAEDYVRGELDIEGTPPDMMAVAGALVGDPVQRGSRRGGFGWLSRLRSRWLHDMARDAWFVGRRTDDPVVFLKQNPIYRSFNAPPNAL